MKYIYHITDFQTLEKAKQKNVYDFCTLQIAGFIHASTIDQYQNILNTKFKDRKDLVLLKIDTELVNEKIVYENLEGGSELSPPKVPGPQWQ